MSQADVDVVHSFNSPYEGTNLVPATAAFIEQLRPDFKLDEVRAVMEAHPAFRHIHDEIEWETRVPGLMTLARGAREFALWWADWLEAWESYVYKLIEYRDLGNGWVLTPVDLRARSCRGVDVSLRLFQLHSVRDGKVAVVRLLTTEDGALSAAAGATSETPSSDA